MESTKVFVDPSGHEWRSVRSFIFWLFNGRCIVCGNVGTEVNHIVPKARGRDYKYDWKNMVLLCNEHHIGVYHHNGVTDEKIEVMLEKRTQSLRRLNRAMYL